MDRFCQMMKDESGATAIEYGLIATATGLGIAAIMPSIRTNMSTIYNDITNAVATGAAG